MRNQNRNVHRQGGYFLGIDAGTSGLKALLIDERGVTGGHSLSTYELLTPRPGWAESNPDDWWDALCGATRSALEKAGIAGDEIRAVGFSGQMHTLVLLDDRQRPVRPAISWADARGAEECAEIEARMGRQRLIEITGSPGVPAFTATKLLWVKQHEPEVWERTRLAILPKDYLRLRLTGAVAADPSDAGATGLLDLRTRDWSPAMRELLELPDGLLPEIVPSTAVAGALSEEAAEATGLQAGTPVATGAGDQEAAALGCGITAPGPLLITVGTGGQVFAATAAPLVDLQGRIHSLPHALPGVWHVLAAIPAAGLAVTWLNRLIAGREAPLRPSSSPPIFLPALAGERTPSMDDQARGAFVGLTLAHGQDDLLFAAREGVAFALRTCVEVLADLGVLMDPIVVTGGFSADADFLQLLADVLARPLRPAAERDASAYGAALMGAISVGGLSLPAEPATRGEIARPDARRAAWHDRRYAIYHELRGFSQTTSRELARLPPPVASDVPY